MPYCRQGVAGHKTPDVEPLPFADGTKPSSFADIETSVSGSKMDPSGGA
jgi:hypothetical protein